MNRIVPWQLATMLVTVGTYIWVLAVGGSGQAAVIGAVAVTMVTFAASVAAGALVADDSTATAAAAATLVAFFACICAGVAAFGAPFAFFAVAFAAAFAVAATGVAEDFDIQQRWTFTAYGIEACAILGALATGSVGLAAVIGTIGMFVLVALWKFGPVAFPQVTGAASTEIARSGG